MKIVLAPPGAGHATLSTLVAATMNVDSVLQLDKIYHTITESYGEGWYFNERATKDKDMRVAEQRLLLDKAPAFSRIIVLTHESALVNMLDKCFVAVPSADELIQAQLVRKKILESTKQTPNWSEAANFVYPDLTTAERIRMYYTCFAKYNNFRLFEHMADAVAEMLD